MPVPIKSMAQCSESLHHYLQETYAAQGDDMLL